MAGREESPPDDATADAGGKTVVVPPRRGRRVLVGVAAALALLAAALVAGGAWLLTTEAGLRRVLAAVERVGPVTIRAEGARGTLAGPLAIDRLAIGHERVEIVAEGIATDLAVRSLAGALVRLERLDVRAVRVQVRERTQPPTDEPPRFLPPWLRLAVDRATVGLVDVRAPSGAGVAIRDVEGRLAMGAERLRVTGVRARDADDLWAVEGDATLRAADPLGVDGDVRWRVRLGERRLAGTATVGGDLEVLQLRATTTAPAGAAYAGSVRVVDGFGVDGRLTLARFDPATLGAGEAVGPVDGALGIRGGLEAATIRGRLHAPRLPTGPVELALEGGYAERRVAVRAFEAVLVEAGTRLTAAGEVVLAPAAGGAGTTPGAAADVGSNATGAPRIRFAGDWRGLRWPLQGASPVFSSAAGTYSLAGDGRYVYAVDGDVRSPGLPAGRLRARGTVTADDVELADFTAQVLRGTVQGTAYVSWRDAQPWRARLRARGVDPAGLRPELPGRVNLELAAEGLGFEPDGRWDARIARLDGRVRGLPARGTGRLSMRDGELRVAGLDVHFGSAQVDANGVIGRRSDLAWRVRVDDLGAFVPDAAGSVRSRGSIVGRDGRRALQGTIGARELRWGEFVVAQLVADVDLDTAAQRESFLRVTALNLAHGERRLDELRVALDGRAADHRLVVRGVAGRDSAELVARGAYAVPTATWTATLEDLRIQGPPLLSYRLESPSTVTVARDAVRLSITCFVRDAERVCAAGSWNAGAPWALSAEATALPLALLPLRLPAGTEYVGTVGGAVALRGAPDQRWTGEATVDVAAAEFRYRAPSGRVDVVRVGNGRIVARAAPDALVASLGLATVGGSFLAGTATLARVDGGLAEAPLTGEATLVTRELGWLPLFAPEIDRVAGELSARLAFAGTAAAPQVTGGVDFADGELDIYRTNLLLRGIRARVELQGDALALDASAATKGGTARANGRIAWRDRAPAGELRFVGERLLVADLPEARVIASPDLRFAIAGRRIDVDGEVRVPFARIVPKDLRGAVLPSGDERIVGEAEDESGGGFEVHTTVRLVLDEKDVKLDAYGLVGDLGGSLLLRARPNEVATGSGELVVRNGTYTAYTRELSIERGRLLFAGQSLGNPGLDVRAQRKIGTATAGVNVRGTLLRPQLTFYSDPPMSQSQVASMIIVGRTLDDVQDGSGAAFGSQEARNQLVAQGGALLAGQIGRYVGLDEVGVESEGSDTSIVVGKFLSPRLYVSYGVSLAETINTLKLRYTIGDSWVIRVESGVRQSADVEYTIER